MVICFKMVFWGGGGGVETQLFIESDVLLTWDIHVCSRDYEASQLIRGV